MLFQSYSYGEGGLGDMLRSMFAYFVYCKKNNIQYSIYFNHHPYQSCFKENKPDTNGLKDDEPIFVDIGSTSTDKTREFLNKILDNSKIWTVRSNIFDFVPLEELRKFTKEFREFLELSDQLKERISKFKHDFVSIHVRRGDVFMPNVNIRSDSRLSDLNDIISNISNIKKLLNTNLPIFLFSDNEELKRHYINHPELGISCLNTKIHHTAIHTGYHTDIIGTIDSVSEFFIMGRSKKIVALSNSGFSFWSAFIHDVPLYKYSNNQLEIMNTINY